MKDNKLLTKVTGKLEEETVGGNNFQQYFCSNSEHAEMEDLLLEVNALILAESLTSAEVDTLEAAWKYGMISSGDCPSKVGRNGLLSKGILCQTSCKKEDYAFSVTFPKGYTVYKALQLILNLKHRI